MRQNPHVRICGGPGSATTLVYPTPVRRGSRHGPQIRPGPRSWHTQRRGGPTPPNTSTPRARLRVHAGRLDATRRRRATPASGASPNGRRQRPHARRASRPGRGWDPRDWPRSLAVRHLSCRLDIRYLFAMVRVLAPFAVDQAACLRADGEQRVDSSASSDSVGWTVTDTCTTATKIRRVRPPAVKMSRNAKRWLTRPACIAGVLVSRPNLNARCSRMKL